MIVMSCHVIDHPFVQVTNSGSRVFPAFPALVVLKTLSWLMLLKDVSCCAGPRNDHDQAEHFASKACVQATLCSLLLPACVCYCTCSQACHRRRAQHTVVTTAQQVDPTDCSRGKARQQAGAAAVKPWSVDPTLQLLGSTSRSQATAQHQSCTFHHPPPVQWVVSACWDGDRYQTCNLL